MKKAPRCEEQSCLSQNNSKPARTGLKPDIINLDGLTIAQCVRHHFCTCFESIGLLRDPWTNHALLQER